MEVFLRGAASLPLCLTISLVPLLQPSSQSITYLPSMNQYRGFGHLSLSALSRASTGTLVLLFLNSLKASW